MEMLDKIFTLLFSNEVKGTEIARLTGISESGIYEVKRGKRNYMNYTLKTAKRLSDCFDILEKENKVNRHSSYDKALKNFYSKTTHMSRK